MEVGNRVVVDGVEATVQARHAAGKHVQWTLSDGRVIADLHLNKEVQVLHGAKVEEKKSWQKKLESFPLVDTDRKNAIGEDLHD